MEPIEVNPVRIKVTAIIRKAILSGEFSGGQALSLTDMAEQLGVSRTPVREAFQTLSAEGLIELRMNKGAIVQPIDAKFVRDHFDTRILLEGETAALAANAAFDWENVIKSHAWAEENAVTMPMEAYRDYNFQFHSSIWRAADNHKLYQYAEALWNGPSVGRFDSPAEHRARSVWEHRSILDALLQKDAAAARRAMQTHLRNSKEKMLESFSTLL